MSYMKGAAFLLFLLIANRTGFPQLRNISEYTQDRINPEKTYFVLHDNGDAEFGWTSEWTQMTALALDGKSAIMIWHFKDGSKAYSQQGEGIGYIGMNSGYLLTNKASTLEDIHHKKIQPLTRDNYPVKVELWIGEIGDSTGFSPEKEGDEVCFESPAIKYNVSYSFSNCSSEEKETK
jgi:hypothetical protein